MEKRKRKTRPCRIYRIDAIGADLFEAQHEAGYSGETVEVLVPVDAQYQTVASAMSGLREHVRLLDVDAEPAKYVIARIQAELTATAKRRVDVILEEN